MFTWLASNWIDLIAVIFTFGFMIFVHELGHFVMAKRVGITVHEFALGFGPKLLSFGKKKGKEGGEEEEDPDPTEQGKNKVHTEYNLRAIPFGGFVSMEGEDEPGDPDDPGNFNNKGVFERFKVIVAGCMMNYVAGIIVLLLVGFVWGIPRPSAQVGSLIEGYPLEKSGVKKGDIIRQVDNTKIRDFTHLSKLISKIKDNRKVHLVVERDGQTLHFKVPVKYDEEVDRGMLGFSPPMGMMSFTFVRVPPGQVFSETLLTTYRLTLMPVTIVRMLVSRKITTKQIAKGTAGPVGIGQMIFEVSKRGFSKLLYICALLSILIGAFNLLPFPMLDGSRVVFLAIEGIRGRPVDPEKEGMIHQVGFVILMILVLLVTYNDILRLIRGENIVK